MTLYFQIESSEHDALSPPPLPPPRLAFPALPTSTPPPSGFPGLWAWSFESFILLKFLLYLLVFLRSFRVVSMPFVPLHCSYHLGVDCDCVRMGNRGRGVDSHVFWSPCNMSMGGGGSWKVWCLERVPLSLVHTVMMCLCQKFLYISFISWKKVYFYVFRSMNGTL